LSGIKKPSSTRKYFCPECSMSVRATRDVRIICADCGVLMKKYPYYQRDLEESQNVKND